MKKKALSLALALVMCLGLTLPAFAAEQKTVYVQYADTIDSSGLNVSSSRTVPAGEEKEASLRLESDGLTETGVFYEAWGDTLTGPYPVYTSASPVKVTLTEGFTKEEVLQEIAKGDEGYYEGGVNTLRVDKVSYNEADKSITVLQENAAFFDGMIYFAGKDPCTIETYYSQDEAAYEEYFWSAPSIEVGSSVTLSQPGTYCIRESWSFTYGSTQALIVISESQTEKPIDLSGNQYLKVSKNPISWVHVVGDDGLGNDCDIVVLLLADDTTITVTIPQGQEDKGSFNFWGVAEASGDGANQLESFSETAYSDGKYRYEFQDEKLEYITESYAGHLVNKGYKVEKISAEEAAKLLAQVDSTTPPAVTEEDSGTAKSETAMPTNDKLTVNNNPANPTVYKIGGSNYFKIRDVAALLNGTEKQFDVGYDGTKNAVTATTGQGYAKQDTDLAGAATGGNQTAAVSNDVIYVDGQKIEAEVYKIGGSNYFKLRDLGKALNFYVGWTQERGMYIETDKPYSE